MPAFNEPIYGYPYVYRVPGLVIGFAREWLRFFGFHTGWLRATLVALLLFGLTLAEVCLAARLGVMTVRSAQGQPFDAEVALLDWDETSERPRVAPVEPLRVRLAGRDEVLWPTAWLDTARIGNTVVRVRTEFEISEPAFELTLRIDSHRGRMVVTYPISLRPPSLNLTGPGERVRGVVALDDVAGASSPKPSTRPETTSWEQQQDRLPPCPADQAASWHNCFGLRGHSGGGSYAGEWQDNKRHGQGTHVLPSGARYVGEFKEDKFHGQGIYYEANRSIFRSGRWENDRVAQSFAIDPARFPFESESEAERLAREASERKAAEVRAEEERRRLEAERLAREASERQAAEARHIAHILSTYEANQARFHVQFRGQVLTGTAVVRKVTTDVFGQGKSFNIFLASKNSSLICSTSNRDLAASFDKNQSVEYRGAIEDVLLGALVLKDCALR